jgi:hypothetical protein
VRGILHYDRLEGVGQSFDKIGVVEFVSNGSMLPGNSRRGTSAIPSLMMPTLLFDDQEGQLFDSEERLELLRNIVQNRFENGLRRGATISSVVFTIYKLA